MTLAVHSAAFSDIDEFATATGWDLLFCQLSCGPTDTRMSLLDLGEIKVMRVAFNQALQQSGSAPHGFTTFGVLDSGSQPFNFHGERVSPGQMICFNQPNGFRAATHPGHNAFTVSISHRMLAHTAELADINLEPGDDARLRPVYSRSRQSQALLRALHGVLGGIQHTGELESPLAAGNLQFELAHAIASIIARPGTTTNSTSASNRRNVLRRANDYIDANLLRDFSIRELCCESYTSWSTLLRAFKDEYGCTPKDYIRATRLHRVRRELNTGSESTTVRETAERWGFRHMGQFAHAYRSMFGELPSATLGREAIDRPSID